MDNFQFHIVIHASVDAFDISDANSAIMDAFGVGDDCGVEIVSSEVSLVENE